MYVVTYIFFTNIPWLNLEEDLRVLSRYFFINLKASYRVSSSIFRYCMLSSKIPIHRVLFLIHLAYPRSRFHNLWVLNKIYQPVFHACTSIISFVLCNCAMLSALYLNKLRSETKDTRPRCRALKFKQEIVDFPTICLHIIRMLSFCNTVKQWFSLQPRRINNICMNISGIVDILDFYNPIVNNLKQPIKTEIFSFTNI